MLSYCHFRWIEREIDRNGMLSYAVNAVTRGQPAMKDNRAAVANDHAFFHPVMPAEAAAVLAGKRATADTFKMLLYSCLPALTYGDAPLNQSGYHRMVAIAYRVAPEIFDGMTARQVAKKIGISREAFDLQLAEADQILVRQRASRPDDVEQPREDCA